MKRFNQTTTTTAAHK